MPLTAEMEKRIRELEEMITSLEEINRVLMERVERSIDSAGSAFSLFETNILLQQRIRQHTEELERSNLKLQAEIAERKRAEKEVRESQARFQDIAMSTSDCIWEVDAKGTYTFCSEKVENVLGYTPQEIIGKTPFDLMPPEEAERTGHRFREIAAAKAPIIDLENWNLHKDGHLVCLLTSGIPVLDAQGDLIGYRGADKDITERVRVEAEKAKLEAQLRQAQKMEAIGTLAGGIAHDFNNILMAMLGCTDMAMYDIARDSVAYANLEEVLKAGLRAKDLVLQILTFSRQMEQERQPVAVSPIVKEALKLIRASLPTTIEIRHKIDFDCGTVMGDPTQIHQVIMNLCTNAYHAMREKGGILEITVRSVEVDAEFARTHANLQEGPYMRIIVSDSGHGMDRPTQERIFEPFYTTKGVGEGTGMGLATVHGIVSSYGGAISLYSELGRGTTFQVYLPQIRRKAPSETSKPEPVARGEEAILFVDDEMVLARIGQQMLERLGYTVTARTSSVEALELFRASPDRFDLVITDMTMPNMTGLELAEELMRIRPDIPLILVTGFSEAVTPEKAKQMGIREFIMKPIISRDLSKVIRQVMDKDEQKEEVKVEEFDTSLAFAY